MSHAGRGMSVDRDLHHIWSGVLGRLQLELNPHNFSTLQHETAPDCFDGETLLVRASNPFYLDWLNRQIRSIARRQLCRVVGHDADIRFVGGGAPEPAPAEPVQRFGSPLNQGFTFGAYLPGLTNSGAIRACRAQLGLSEGDAPVTPLLVWGSPGVGKSHLLHAAGNCAAESGRRVVLLTGEEFANAYSAAIRAKDAEEFHSTVRSASLLVIDDLQYLSGRTGTLNELANSIDAVQNRGGHVLLASELPPLDLALPERLTTRLLGGLAVEIGPVAAADRRALVEHLARRARASLPAWCLERIAACGCCSARLLQGAVNSAVSLDREGRLALENLDRALASLVMAGSAREQVNADRLLATVAAHFEVTLDELRGRSRKAQVRDARAVAAAALHQNGESIAAIAARFDGRDPSTLSGLVPRGEELLKALPQLQARLAG